MPFNVDCFLHTSPEIVSLPSQNSYFNFVLVVFVVLTHQMYDIYLYCIGYLVDWEHIPPISKDRLRFNKKLFERQTSALLKGNIVFGVLSILTVAAGYFIINKQNQPNTHLHLLCIHGYEWIYLSPVGNLFGTFHQVLILMQINITQYVMVKIPRWEGVFEANQAHEVGLALRQNLLAKGD